MANRHSHKKLRAEIRARMAARGETYQESIRPWWPCASEGDGNEPSSAKTHQGVCTVQFFSVPIGSPAMHVSPRQVPLAHSPFPAQGVPSAFFTMHCRVVRSQARSGPHSFVNEQACPTRAPGRSSTSRHNKARPRTDPRTAVGQQAFLREEATARGSGPPPAPRSRARKRPSAGSDLRRSAKTCRSLPRSDSRMPSCSQAFPDGLDARDELRTDVFEGVLVVTGDRAARAEGTNARNAFSCLRCVVDVRHRTGDEIGARVLQCGGDARGVIERQRGSRAAGLKKVARGLRVGLGKVLFADRLRGGRGAVTSTRSSDGENRQNVSESSHGDAVLYLGGQRPFAEKCW